MISGRALNTVPSIVNPSKVASWNCAIRAAIGNGLHREALLIYRRMRQAGIQPDHLTFPFFLKACSRLSDIFLPGVIHTHILKCPLSSNVFVGTAMVDFYAKCQQIDHAQQLFDEMPLRDVAAWNALIMGLVDTGSHGRVFLLFKKMRLDERHPDSVTIIVLTRSCAQNKNVGVLKAVHSIGFASGLGVDLSVCNTWIAAYAKCDDLTSAESVFNEIPLSQRSVVSWNSIIAGCAYHGRSEKVSAYFQNMRDDDIKADLSTVLSLLSSFAHSEALIQGRIIHSLAIKAGFDLDITISNTLILLYSNCGDIIAARYCFDSMLERTSVSWTAVITGYVKALNLSEAMNLFHSMENSEVRADAITMISILSACSRTGSLEFGRSMERYSTSSGIAENDLVCNALIDMYAKCGSITDARRVFASMNERKTLVSWTALIAGYAMNGDFIGALNLFSQMLELQYEPNHVTFLAVLQACTHGGLLEEGWKLFDMMRIVYCLEPRLEHYACMSDLLGRRGKIKEALKFIEEMPIEPDCGVWGALLGSCIIQRETEVGEYAASRLFQLEPDAASSYVAMANIYASKERWDGVAELRMMMRRKKLKKAAGQSIVQVNGKAHGFTVEDRVHPEGSNIYGVLDCLTLHMKEEDNLDNEMECNMNLPLPLCKFEIQRSIYHV
ncbi:Pentatricopeptide repeat-containing protein [Apostasia shenzhenica]|uniref:Pentatricopeptide repeat-containing protein n=1 Tax=Apostasia shenzhenica TaxID=1088818 RepID=A0A2I0A0L1_9ASPA|nr:Pentatricopeptide repeat-containing protein [Apostasia shenzhenica]